MKIFVSMLAGFIAAETIISSLFNYCLARCLCSLSQQMEHLEFDVHYPDFSRVWTHVIHFCLKTRNWKVLSPIKCFFVVLESLSGFLSASGSPGHFSLSFVSVLSSFSFVWFLGYRCCLICFWFRSLFQLSEVLCWVAIKVQVVLFRGKGTSPPRTCS